MTVTTLTTETETDASEVVLQALPAGDLIGAHFDCPTCANAVTVAAFDETSVWVECPCDMAVVERTTFITFNPLF